MKLIINTFFIFTLVTLLLPSGVSALTRGENDYNVNKATIEARRMELKDRIAEVKASRSAQLSELRKNRIRSYWQKLMQRLSVHIERQEKLISRLEDRIAQIQEESEDIDTSEVVTTLADAKAVLATAKVDLQATNDTLEDILTSSSPREAFMEVRENIRDIRDKIKEVHVMLVQVIGDLKGLRVGQQN